MALARLDSQDLNSTINTHDLYQQIIAGLTAISQNLLNLLNDPSASEPGFHKPTN